MTNKNKFTERDLAHFTGTLQYWTHWTKLIVYTDGVKFVADRGASWAVEIAASYQTDAKIKKEPFQVWIFEKDAEGSGGVARCEDGNGHVLITQKLEYMDLPIPRLDLWLESGVLILPSEH